MALSALNKRHNKNVLHNDIQMENFLIMNQENCRHRSMICDFGNSLIVNSSKKKQLKNEENNCLKRLLNYVE